MARLSNCYSVNCCNVLSVLAVYKEARFFFGHCFRCHKKTNERITHKITLGNGKVQYFWPHYEHHACHNLKCTDQECISNRIFTEEAFADTTKLLQNLLTDPNISDEKGWMWKAIQQATDWRKIANEGRG